jgi:high-affinity Fe2+/Pb2+ permease
MNMFDRMFIMAAINRKGPSFMSRLIGLIVMFLIGLGVAYGGVKSGYIEWVLIGLVWAAIAALATVLMVLWNIHKNRRRW